MENPINAALLEKLEQLPVNAQVALALACAERALDAFAEQAADDMLETMEVYDRCKAALRDGWAWETERSTTVYQLYAHLEPLLVCEYRYNLTQRPRLRDALFSVISAMYFTTWKAEGYAYNHGLLQEPLPNDIADVTMESLTRCMDYAVRASVAPGAERNWQTTVIDRLVEEFTTSETSIWGNPVYPEYFDI